MAHQYDVGTRAWQPDAVEGWIESEVADKRVEAGGKVSLVFALGNGSVGPRPKLGVGHPGTHIS